MGLPAFKIPTYRLHDFLWPQIEQLREVLIGLGQEYFICEDEAAAGLRVTLYHMQHTVKLFLDNR